jgi:hypothetical protein
MRHSHRRPQSFANYTGTWRKVTPRSADSDEIFVTLTNQGLSPATRPARSGGQKKPAASSGTLYQALYRPTELSLQSIRWIRVHLTCGPCYRAALAMLRPLMLKYI